MGIGQIFVGAAPFLLANVLVLTLNCLFPELVLWIPSALNGLARLRYDGLISLESVSTVLRAEASKPGSAGASARSGSSSGSPVTGLG